MKRTKQSPIRIRARDVAAVGTFVLAGCGSGGFQMEPRYVALHNTMMAMGYAQTGGLQEGTLSEGAETVSPLRVSAGECVTVVALAESGVRNVDLIVRDESGRELARDQTSDAQAAARFCAPYAGNFVATVRMVSGGGHFLVTSWSGGASSGSGDRYGGTDRYGADRYGGGERPSTPVVAPPHGGPGTCEAPFELTASESRRGNTQTGDSSTAGSCVGGGRAPEQVYSIVLTQRSLVTASIDSTFDGTIYLLGACGQARSELACNDDAPTTEHSEVSVALDPGTYFLVVDGFGTASGEYEVRYTASPSRTAGELCRAATPLVPGGDVSGTTTGETGSFAGSCAGQGADRVYSLDVTEASRARIRMQSSHDGVLYLRSSCADPSTELACNDDHQDTRHSLLTANLSPGRYFVFADGFTGAGGPGAAGDFSLGVELAPAAGSGAAGESCANPLPHVAGQPITVDTFRFADDSAGSCGGQGAPDITYRVVLTSRTRVRATFPPGSEFQPLVYIQTTCGAVASEVACASAGGTGLDQILAPGTYFITIDGNGANAFGAASVTLQMDDLGALETACRSAPLLRPGTQISANTSSSTDRFQATCAAGARSADQIYRLVIRRRSMVRIASEQADFDGALYLRRDCMDAVTELGCNDDAGDNRHSIIETVLEPGTYFVFVDGFAESNQGAYTLDVDITTP